MFHQISACLVFFGMIALGFQTLLQIDVRLVLSAAASTVLLKQMFRELRQI